MASVENKIDKYISREYQIIVVVASIFSAFYFLVLCPINDQRAALNSIKDNHLVHIESDIVEIRKKQADRDITDAQMRENIVKILTILEEQKANSLR